MEKCFAVVNGGDSVAAWLELFGSCFISRAAKTENPVRSSVFLCSETKRKHLLRRLCTQMHLDAQDVPLARARFQASSADWDSANGPGNEAAIS